MNALRGAALRCAPPEARADEQSSRRKRMRTVDAGAGQLAPATVSGGGDRGVPERATLQVRGRARGWDGMGWGGARLGAAPGGKKSERRSERGPGKGLRVGSPKARQKASWGVRSGGPVKKERLWGKELCWRTTWESPQPLALGGGGSFLD